MCMALGMSPPKSYHRLLSHFTYPYFYSFKYASFLKFHYFHIDFKYGEMQRRKQE